MADGGSYMILYVCCSIFVIVTVVIKMLHLEKKLPWVNR